MRRSADGRHISIKFLCALLGAVVLWAQPQPPPPYVQKGKTVKVAEHIWMIPDGRVNLVPNVGIVVGSKATLVVDSGMGLRNGEVVLHEVQKVSRNTDVYLTSTHFHPEHVTGFLAFPAAAKVLRPMAQEKEVISDLQRMIADFSRISPAHAELLKDARYRAPDIVFDSSIEIDLGGVTARLFTLGPAHTRGDSFIYVRGAGEANGVLFTGDVVTNRFFPIIIEGSDGGNWISILDKLAALKPRIVVPGHGGVEDLALIERESAVLKEMQARTAQLKKQGKSAEDAAALLTKELKAKYPSWDNPEFLPNDVKRFYAEAQ
jgi:glyoxylase-like metal-dependent hydrolase (beta-lactamase superfamily II)